MMDTSKWNKEEVLNADRVRCFQVGILWKYSHHQKAVEYVKKQANNDKPFFLYFAFPSHKQSFQMTSSMVSQVRGLMGIVCETDDACGQFKALEREAGR